MKEWRYLLREAPLPGIELDKLDGREDLAHHPDPHIRDLRDLGTLRGNVAAEEDLRGDVEGELDDDADNGRDWADVDYEHDENGLEER